jgi:hypothetical protein
MAIQFKCVACDKPVEVDDPWAGRLVECPYCHETITAPRFGASGGPDPDPGRLGGPSDPPLATPSVAPTVPPHQPFAGFDGPPPVPAQPAGTRTLAIVALVLACLSLGAGLAAVIPISMQMVEELGPDPSEQELEAWQEQWMESPPSWLVPVGLGCMGSCGLWIAGLVCGLIAVFRPVGRGIAIAALVVLALPAVMLAFSMLLGL